MPPAKKTTRRARSALEQLAKRALRGARATERAGDAAREQRITGLRGAAKAVVLSELVRAHADRPVLLLVASSKLADAWAAELTTLLGTGTPGDGQWSERIHTFPRHDTLPYERFSPQPFLGAARMASLYRWLASSGQTHDRRSDPGLAPIVVAPQSAFALRVPSPDSIREHTLHLEIGHEIDRDVLAGRLAAAGYARMPIVEEPGEFAVRGGIVDIYPPHEPRPIRIDMLGDEIESLRDFDPASQRSQEKRSSVAAPPPRELLFDRDRVIACGDAIRELAIEQEIADQSVDALIDALLRGNAPPGCEALAPALLGKPVNPIDYLPDDTLIVIDEPGAARERLATYREDAERNFEAAIEAGRVACPPSELLVDSDALQESIAKHTPISLERVDIEDFDSPAERHKLETRAHDELRRELARTRTHDRALTPLADQLGEWLVERWRVVICCHQLSSVERLRTLLSGYGIETRLANDTRPVWRWSAAGRCEVRVSAISEGFACEPEKLAIVTEDEIFGPREKRRKRQSWKDGTAVEGIAQLAPGDYLVHADHGIGIYRGLIEMKVGAGPGRKNELLCMEYTAGDKLFLPVHRLNLVQRYGGADATTPRVDRLGGQSWERAKTKVRRSLRVMAQELLSVHAARELTPGFQFAPRDEYFESFEGAFPFEETPDQAAAIDDVLADMGRDRPMDRLVCGDVGYGKTEVACRAAFRAALDGKQVAVLVPTTVLCQQHAETFIERFEGYPVKVAALSRFTSPKQSKKILEQLATGELDVVVGTHRLLGKNVRFRDLGLLVVDEEHRFGVTHKERIKQMRKTVDVLTLTATPIPRTLQLAFAGMRELSVIDTPPADRLAVRTQVSRSSESLLREAILREVRRGGQVFFVHNRVQSIGRVYDMLAKLVPEVKVIVAHGQMRERELEEKMLAFDHGEADVLLCTTIIESGIDIPRANTIIIDRADALGLAQLHQLRGRVGRSTHRAYAYLLIPVDTEALPGDAQRRLEAIQDLSELGGGFKLANMDLEIRGAGNLLGGEQSGNLLAVGYETYMEMLEETIEELRGKIRQREIDPEIRLPLEARLPEAYVPDVSQRLVLYKRLASARGDDEIARIRDELLDRFGPLPLEGENLLGVIRLKAQALKLGITAIDLARGEIALHVGETAKLDATRLVNLMTHGDAPLRVSPDHKIFGPAPGPEGGAPALIDATQQLMTRLGA